MTLNLTPVLLSRCDVRMRAHRLTWKQRRILLSSSSHSQEDIVLLVFFMSRHLSCKLCCGSNNRVDPQNSVKSGEKQFTGVEIDTGSSEQGEDNNSSSQWTVPGVFKSIFHASPDNKLAVKLYGSKKELLIQKKINEKGSKKWMIHPYSHFR